MTAPIGFLEDSEEGQKDRFPLVYKPTHYIFCLGNKNKSYLGRIFKYATPYNIINEAGKHLKKYAPNDQVPCPHPSVRGSGTGPAQCDGFQELYREGTQNLFA